MIFLPNHLLTTYLLWVNHLQDTMCNNLCTISYDMEGTAHDQCKNIHRIFSLFSVASPDTWHIFPSIWTGPRCSHYRLQYKFKGLAVPYVQSLPLFVQGPLQLLQEKAGRLKEIIRGSCSTNPQNGIPTVTVNRKYASFPIYFLHKDVIIQGTTIRWYV